MKKVLFLFSVVLLLQSCEGTDASDTIVSPTQQMIEKKQEIQNYINSFSCSSSVGCSAIALGDKPCGGPREYLVFSNAVNLTLLQTMVAEYNLLDKQNNIKTNAVSDCMMVLPPTNIGCVNGVCGIIN
jgi:hypothetical protein